MTHYAVAIIIPPAEDDIQGFIDRQMQPYDESITVAPYVCYSVERAAKDLADEICRLELIVRREEPLYNLDKCRHSLAKLRQMTPEQKYREFLAVHERFDAKGEPLSTYNPAGKWDWYVIGGRWNGWINDQEGPDGELAANMATTEQAVARGKIPHAIITPDGLWHEHGTMGWWGLMLTENEGWGDTAKALFAVYPGHNIVIVDAHI